MKKGFENPTNKKIFNTRKRKKVSEEKMAEILGLTRSTYRYHEQSSYFTPEQIEKIADFFGVTVSSLECDLIDFSSKPTTTRLSDVNEFHLRVGDTLFPSDLVLSMEKISKLPADKRRTLMDCIEMLSCIEEDKFETIKKYIEFLNS